MTGERLGNGAASQAFTNAERCIELGDFRGAKAAVTRALSHDPHNYSLLAMAAYVAVARGEVTPAEGVARLDVVIETAPSCGLAFHYRGLLQRRLGDLHSALSDQQMARRINPYHGPSRREIAELQESVSPPSSRPTGLRRWWRRFTQRK